MSGRKDTAGAKARSTVVMCSESRSFTSLRTHHLQWPRKKLEIMSVLVCARRRDKVLLHSW